MDGCFDPDDTLGSSGELCLPADGDLLDISSLGIGLRFQGRPVDRMTRHLFEDLWPSIERESSLTHAFVKLVRGKLRQAEYLAGPQEHGWFFELPNGTDDPIWLVQNERGTWTVMLSSDY